MFLEPAAVPTASAELRADRTLASLALHSSAKVINMTLLDPNYSACLLLGRLWVPSHHELLLLREFFLQSKEILDKYYLHKEITRVEVFNQPLRFKSGLCGLII